MLLEFVAGAESALIASRGSLAAGIVDDEKLSTEMTLGFGPAS